MVVDDRDRIIASLRSLVALQARQVTELRAALAEAIADVHVEYCSGDHHFRSCEKYRALLSAGDKAEAPRKPKRERIDWKNVVVDEGDEAP